MPKKNLIVASNNTHKISEIKNILNNHFNVFPKSFIKNAPEIEETGTTFLENARLKAIGLSRYTGELVLADDSGIEVDALDGKPGIYSSRFAGKNATDKDNNQKLLELLKNLPPNKRTAKYRCVTVLAKTGEEIAYGEGICSGSIMDAPLGSSGFGYDPLFWSETHQKSFAQLSQAEKNKISHRFRALEDLLKKLNNSLAV